MAYWVTHRYGAVEEEYPSARFGDLLDELASADVEHSEVSITHESEWSLSIDGAGFVVFEHLEENDPKHLGPIERGDVLRMMTLVAHGDISELQLWPWRRGYPSNIVLR